MELKDFYRSKAWQHCRNSYLKKVGGLCERCLKDGLYNPAVVVHHKCYITPENVTDPRITMNFENLEALCWHHHELEHKGKKRRFTVDKLGRVTAIDTGD